MSDCSIYANLAILFHPAKRLWSIAPAGYVLAQDFEKEMQHPAASIRIDVVGRSVNQVATELHPVGISFAAGMVGNYCLLAVYSPDCACKIIMRLSCFVRQRTEKK